MTLKLEFLREFFQVGLSKIMVISTQPLNTIKEFPDQALITTGINWEIFMLWRRSGPAECRSIIVWYPLSMFSV